MASIRFGKVMIEDLEVTIESHIDTSVKPRVIKCFAKCGETFEQGTHTLHAKHDRLDEHLEKDHRDFVQRLAEEAAGHERSRLLLVRFAEKSEE